MGYDAIGLAAEDLAAGKELFLSREFTGLPFVSCNIIKKDNLLVFQPSIIKKIGGVSIGIIGITGGEVSADCDLVIDGWQKRVQKELATLGKKTSFIVALSSLSAQENLILAQQYPQVQLIVSTRGEYGNTARLLDQKSHSPLLVQVAGEGSFLGQLSIHWSLQADGWRELPEERVEELQQKIDYNLQRLALFTEKLAQAGENKQLFKEKIVREKRIIAKYQSRLEFITTTKELVAQKMINGFTPRFRKIYPKPGSQEIIHVVDEIIKKSKEVSF